MNIDYKFLISIKKIVSIFVMAMVLYYSSSLIVYADMKIKDYVTVGTGSNCEEALQDGLWKAVTAGMAKEIGDVSQNEKVLSNIKELYKKNENRFIRKYIILSQKTESGKQKMKLHVFVNISTIKEDSKKIIAESAGGTSKLPFIAIMADNTAVEGALGQQFSTYGYNLIDFSEGIGLKKTRLKLFREGDIEFKYLLEAMNAWQTTGADILLVASTSFKKKGDSPVSGLPVGALTLHVKTTDVITGDIIAQVTGTVKLSTGGNLYEEIVSKAAKVIFYKVNNQIISSWNKNQNILVVNVINVTNDDMLIKILEVLVEISGDDDFSEKTDEENSKATYRFINKKKWSKFKVKKTLHKIKKITGMDSVKIIAQDRVIKISL